MPSNHSTANSKRLQRAKKGMKQEVAYEYIRDAIISKEYKAQQLLNEAEISSSLGGISRTPIRDAMQRLAFEGLINYIPGKGMYVAEVKFEDILQIMQARLALEKAAMEMFVEQGDRDTLEELAKILEAHQAAYVIENYDQALKFDDKFHRTIARGSKNSRIEGFINTLLLQSAQYKITMDPERVSQALEDHQKIFEAIRNNDAEAAKNFMVDHLLGWASFVMSRQMKKLI